MSVVCEWWAASWALVGLLWLVVGGAVALGWGARSWVRWRVREAGAADPGAVAGAGGEELVDGVVGDVFCTSCGRSALELRGLEHGHGVRIETYGCRRCGGRSRFSVPLSGDE